MSRYWRLILFVLVFSLTLASGVHAGGLYLYEVGSPDVGLAGAGYAARADDAATVFTNPAGMTRLDQPSLMMGAQPMYLNLDFNPDGNTSAVAGTLPGGGAADSGDTNGWMPAGGLYYVHPVNRRLRLGVALNGYFGLALDYQDDWGGTLLRAGGHPPGCRYPTGRGLEGERLALAGRRGRRALRHVG